MDPETKTREKGKTAESESYAALKKALDQKKGFVNEVREAFLFFKTKLDLYKELFNEVPAEFDIILRSEIPAVAPNGKGNNGHVLCVEFFPTGKDKEVVKVEARGWAKFGNAIQESLGITERNRKTVRWHADWKGLKNLIQSRGMVIKNHNIEA